MMANRARIPKITKAAYRPILTQETIFDAVTSGPPPMEPLLAAISFSALLAKTNDTIASTIGKITQEAIDSTRAAIELPEALGAVGKPSAG